MSKLLKCHYNELARIERSQMKLARRLGLLRTVSNDFGQDKGSFTTTESLKESSYLLTQLLKRVEAARFIN